MGEIEDLKFEISDRAGAVAGLALEFAETEALDAGAAAEVRGAGAAVEVGGYGQGDAGLMGLETELAGFEVACVHGIWRFEI
jgi:hypothetical protein